MIKIVFLCTENACRSQMAEAFARRFGEGYIEAYSAGSKPSGAVNKYAVAVMQESGIDISSAHSKGIAELPHETFDYAVGMGCGDACPAVSAQRHLQWDIPDPREKMIGEFRNVRDMIAHKVKALIAREINNGQKN